VESGVIHDDDASVINQRAQRLFKPLIAPLRHDEIDIFAVTAARP
jgi:hypothetical protein